MANSYDTVKDCRLQYSSPVQNESAAILLRAKLSAIAQRLGFPERKREQMLLVASELISNQVKHAGGRGLIQIWQQPGAVLDVFALDYGPGISNLSQARQDCFSTANTLGKGLGSIQRLSDELFVYTQQESISQSKKWSGAAFLARFRPGSKSIGRDDDQVIADSAEYCPSGLEIGLFSRSLSDERYNGDRIYLQRSGGVQRWLHLDGLGHGEEAQAATANLAAHLSQCDSLDAILMAVDRQLVRTRGAVAIIGEIDLASSKVHLLGVGDMHAHIYDWEQMQNISFAPGILGREHRSTSMFQADFGKKCLVVTASDGIRRNWDTANFPGLFTQHPQLIAYMLGNIMGRISDDQSICVSAIG